MLQNHVHSESLYATGGCVSQGRLRVPNEEQQQWLAYVKSVVINFCDFSLLSLIVFCVLTDELIVVLVVDTSLLFKRFDSRLMAVDRVRYGAMLVQSCLLSKQHGVIASPITISSLLYSRRSLLAENCL